MAWGLGSMVRRQAWLPRLSQGSLGRRAYCVSLGAPMPSVPDAVGPSASGEELVGQEGPGPEAPGHGRLQQDLGRRGRRRKVVPLLFCAPGPPKQHPAAPLEAKALPGSKQSRGHQPGQKALPGRPCLGQPLCVPGSGFAALQTLPTPTHPHRAPGMCWRPPPGAGTSGGSWGQGRGSLLLMG